MPSSKAREKEIAVIRPPQPRSGIRAVSGAAERRLQGAIEVPIEQVIADPDQPRRDWGHNDGGERLRELAESIREFGILQPLVVRENGTIRDGRQRYIIISGARRRAAAEQAGLAALPVVVRGEESSRVRVLQLVENLQRQNLSPLDEARAYQELLEVEALTPPQLAERLHISAQHVRDRLRILSDQVLSDAVERRQISATVARDIKQLPDDAMSDFRQRVRAGERVRTNDIVDVRGRLADAGIINPRRKVSKAESESELNRIGDTKDSVEKQTSFVNSGPVDEHATKADVEIIPASDDATMEPDRPQAASEQTSFVPKSPETVGNTRGFAMSLGDDDCDTLASTVAGLIESGISGKARSELRTVLLEVRSSRHPLQVWQLVLDKLINGLPESV